MRQDCILTSVLFCDAIDWILDHVTSKPAIEVGPSHSSDLANADSTSLFCLPETDIEVIVLLADFNQTSGSLGLKVQDWSKSHVKNLEGQALHLLQCPLLHRIWKDKRLSLALKICIYQLLILLIFLCVAVAWTLFSADVKMLETFHMPHPRDLPVSPFHQR